MKETEIILSHHVNVNYGDPFIHFLNQFLPVQSLSGAGARHCCCRPSSKVHYGSCQSTAALTQRERDTTIHAYGQITITQYSRYSSVEGSWRTCRHRESMHA